MGIKLRKILPAAVGALLMTQGGAAFSAPWNGNLDTTVSSGGGDPVPSPNDGILTNVTGFDWHANGNAWIQNFDIAQSGSPSSDPDFTLTYQGFATSISSPDATPNLYVAAPGPAAGTYEYTLFLTLQESADRLTSSPFTINVTTHSGTWEILYDTSPDANAGAGTGFRDGATVMSGSFTGGTAIFSSNGPLGEGSGNSILNGTVDFVNPLYANPVLTGTEFTTGLRFPGDPNLPWTRSAGFDQNGNGVLDPGELTGVDNVNNFVLQADAFQSLTTTVPEPMTLALLGSGLLGMGIVGRRRRSG